MLIVMAGLPAAGKSTVAFSAAERLACALVSVDPIEAAILGSGVERAQPTGLAAYVVAEAVAEEQLRLGHTVIVDVVNDVEPARRQWRELAARHNEQCLFASLRRSTALTRRSTGAGSNHGCAIICADIRNRGGSRLPPGGRRWISGRGHG